MCPEGRGALEVAPDEGHSLDHRENRVEFMTRVARFLEDNAK